MIYALVNAETGEARYVGRTQLSKNIRLSEHVSRSERGHKNSPVAKWIRETTEIDITVLEAEPEDETQAELWWMRYLEFLGAELLNVARYPTGGKVGDSYADVPDECIRQLGQKPDAVLAKEFDTTREVIRTRRKNRDISAWGNTGSQFNPPEGCIKQLGEKSDRKLAHEYNVSARKICELRNEREIRPFKESQWLSDEEAGEVKWLARHSDLTQKEIGDRYGISDANVCNIKHENRRAKVEPKRPQSYD